MPKMVAGTERPKSERLKVNTDKHRDALLVASNDATEIVERLRKGLRLLSQMDGAAVYRAEAEELWAGLVMDLYRTLREAYAHFILIWQADSAEAALALWDALLPKVDDLSLLGLPALFAHYRGRFSPPMWITDEEGALITQALWPPVPGEDCLDKGMKDFYGPVPF